MGQSERKQLSVAKKVLWHQLTNPIPSFYPFNIWAFTDDRACEIGTWKRKKKTENIELPLDIKGNNKREKERQTDRAGERERERNLSCLRSFCQIARSRFGSIGHSLSPITQITASSLLNRKKVEKEWSLLWMTENHRQAITGSFEDSTTELYGCLSWKDELQTKRKKRSWFLWDRPPAVMPSQNVTVGARGVWTKMGPLATWWPMLPWKQIRCCRGNRPGSKQALRHHRR